MKRILHKLWHEDDGVLSFEWTIVIVLLVFGIVGGLAAGRDVLIDELGDLAEAVVSIDQSFSFSGIDDLGIPGADYEDPAGSVTDCARQTTPIGLPGPSDGT